MIFQKAIINIPSMDIFIPLISSIIGGLLVWAGQYFDKRHQTKIDTKNKLLEIYAYARKLEIKIKNSYRELAMLKTHVEYWWHCYNSSSSKSEDLPKYYENHLRCQAEARIIEREIGDIKADYIGHVRKFQAIKKIPLEDLETRLNNIADLTQPKAKSYDFSLDHSKLRYELVEQDEKMLRDLYFENLNNLKTLNELLQTLIK